MNAQISKQVADDLAIGKSIAMPICLLILVWAFGLGFTLSVDYSLLTLIRYREERARGSTPKAAIGDTPIAAGHTVAFPL